MKCMCRYRDGSPGARQPFHDSYMVLCSLQPIRTPWRWCSTGWRAAAPFLECQGRSPHVSIKWHLQKDNSDRKKEVRASPFIRPSVQAPPTGNRLSIQALSTGGANTGHSRGRHHSNLQHRQLPTIILCVLQYTQVIVRPDICITFNILEQIITLWMRLLFPLSVI